MSTLPTCLHWVSLGPGVGTISLALGAWDCALFTPSVQDPHPGRSVGSLRILSSQAWAGQLGPGEAASSIAKAGIFRVFV